jgi:hypothetical protein
VDDGLVSLNCTLKNDLRGHRLLDGTKSYFNLEFRAKTKPPEVPEWEEWPWGLLTCVIPTGREVPLLSVSGFADSPTPSCSLFSFWLVSHSSMASQPSCGKAEGLGFAGDLRVTRNSFWGQK